MKSGDFGPPPQYDPPTGDAVREEPPPAWAVVLVVLTCAAIGIAVGLAAARLFPL